MLFRCEQCGCVDMVELAYQQAKPQPPGHYLCSECCPVVDVQGNELPGRWHNQFPKRAYDPLRDIVINVSTGISFS